MRASISIRASRIERGVQLVEFALVLPMLLILVAGVADFAQAWNARQVLANAARDGARLGANQPLSDLDNTSPASIQSICQQVAEYLIAEKIDPSFLGITGTSTSSVSSGCSSPGIISSSSCTTSPCRADAWTYPSTGTYGLKIERLAGIPPTGASVCGAGTGVACILATRITLNYPYNWSFGFNHIIDLFGTASSYPSKIQIQVFSEMPDLAV